MFIITVGRKLLLHTIQCNYTDKVLQNQLSGITCSHLSYQQNIKPYYCIVILLLYFASTCKGPSRFFSYVDDVEFHKTCHTWRANNMATIISLSKDGFCLLKSRLFRQLKFSRVYKYKWVLLSINDKGAGCLAWNSWVEGHAFQGILLPLFCML